MLLDRAPAWAPPFALSWSTSDWGSVTWTVPATSNFADFSWPIALPVVARLCCGVSVLVAPGALSPAQADRRAAARAAPRTRFMGFYEYTHRPGPRCDIRSAARRRFADAGSGRMRLRTVGWQFSAGLVMDILRTHPMAIIGGGLPEKRFFVPPAPPSSSLPGRRPTARPV